MAWPRSRPRQKAPRQEHLGRSHWETGGGWLRPSPGGEFSVFPQGKIRPRKMNTVQAHQEGLLGFLKPYATDSEIFLLSSGAHIPIQKYFLHLKPWVGAPIPNTYNGKAVIDWDGEPVFAELAVLRLFQSRGWEGVWVDSYRRKYRVGLPGVVEPIQLPQKYRDHLESIRVKTGRSGGCWDVLVWKGDEVLFLELKRSKKDRIRASQNDWLEKSLALGLAPSSFALIEWSLEARPVLLNEKHVA